MKAVLSQTIFCGGAHIHHKKRLLADLDSNGWPQTGRNNALREIRKSFALMIAGDQHLATVFHHGVDDWNDAGFSFCVPSIVNYYPRAWFPLEDGIDPVTDALEHTGKYLDGFGNHITMYAYSNPNEKRKKYGRKDKGAAGHGLVRFNKRDRTITLECWPRQADVTNPDHKQYPGWPVVVDQEDNYGRPAVAYLPTLKVAGLQDPVVQIIRESDGEVVYTVRINGKLYRPKVFAKGLYTIKIDNGDEIKTLTGVPSLDAGQSKEIEVNF
jgi:hypothetical protein